MYIQVLDKRHFCDLRRNSIRISATSALVESRRRIDQSHQQIQLIGELLIGFTHVPTSVVLMHVCTYGENIRFAAFCLPHGRPSTASIFLLFQREILGILL